MLQRALLKLIQSAILAWTLTSANTLLGITIDLREPLFTDGVLSTDQGGVITGPNFRVQAKIIIYTADKNQTKTELNNELNSNLNNEVNSDLNTELNNELNLNLNPDRNLESNTEKFSTLPAHHPQDTNTEKFSTLPTEHPQDTNPQDTNTQDDIIEGHFVAQGDLILEIGEYVFVGEKLEYNFTTKNGVLYQGRTSVEPWFIGGDEIHLNPDGSYTIHHAFITTSENYKMTWQIVSEKAKLKDHQFLNAENVKFKFITVPLFWIPRLKIDLDTMFDSPVHYTFRVGGVQGPRVGMDYVILDWNGWKSRIQLDYRFIRGPGGGIEIDYKSPTRNEVFKSINYIANDTTIYNQKALIRYRLQGMYMNLFDEGRSSINLSYDKLSDKEMATDYGNNSLRLDSAKRTELDLRRQREDWILNLTARVRVNSFQTIKQELPTLAGQFRPFTLANTGVVSENRFKASYLELEYTDNTPNVSDYNSPRYEFVQSFYRPFKFSFLNITPQAGTVAIFYGNNKDNFSRWMTIGRFQIDANTDLYRFYGPFKHVMTPYTQYQYYTYPSTSPNDHYIFGIDDGWYRINQLRFGIQNNLYTKTCDSCIYRKAYIDLYAYAFMHTQTIREIIPKVYLKSVINVNRWLRTTNIEAWNFEHNTLDHFNMKLDWTLNNNAAVSTEYRHRSRFDWRKVDKTNFILDSYRSEIELENSSLSDQRDTILLTLFYRVHPNWAFNLQSRSGWNRLYEPSYNEYQIDVLGDFSSAWHFRMSYRHREDDDRFSLNFSMGLDRPETYQCPPVPCLEF